MKVSGFVSLLLLGSFASALPKAKVTHNKPKTTPVHHKTTAVVHTTPAHAKTTTKATLHHTQTALTNSKSTHVVSSKSKSTGTASKASSFTTKITSGTVTGSSSTTATGTETSTGTSTFVPVSCTDISSTTIYRRAFPKVDIKSCSKITDEAELVATLAANGESWLSVLANTQHSPPEPPSNIKDFLSKYTPEIETGKSLRDISANNNDGIAAKIGSFKYNYIKLKTSEGKYPYQAAVSEDGAVLINTYSYSADDVGGKNQGIMFEDIMTYLLAYSSDQAGFTAGTADIPAAMKKIKYIYRSNIENSATKQMIEATYKANGQTKLMQKRKTLTPAIGSNEAKGLIATNNGSLGPKLLGTNMKTFGTGSISNVDIALQPESMLLELTHG